mmetsp:Transcript_17204/g.42928  ORF Transcript_17204/g.42928 Transcript_17204/m.42928 type:complete len:265 (-) Transcript_17204:1238-2032(-)
MAPPPPTTTTTATRRSITKTQLPPPLHAQNVVSGALGQRPGISGRLWIHNAVHTHRRPPLATKTRRRTRRVHLVAQGLQLFAERCILFPKGLRSQYVFRNLGDYHRGPRRLGAGGVLSKTLPREILLGLWKHAGSLCGLGTNDSPGNFGSHRSAGIRICECLCPDSPVLAQLLHKHQGRLQSPDGGTRPGGLRDPDLYDNYTQWKRSGVDDDLSGGHFDECCPAGADFVLRCRSGGPIVLAGSGCGRGNSPASCADYIHESSRF